MNRKEAKFLLSAFRPGGQDANDPQMQEALDQVRNDPTTEEWLRGEMKHDAAIARAVQNISVPEGLRAQILAGVKVTAASSAVPIHPRFRPTAPTLWAAAAAVALLAIFAGGWLQRQRTDDLSLNPGALTEYTPDHASVPVALSGWQADALGTIGGLMAGHEHFDASGPDVARLEQWLAENRGTTAPSVPGSLKEFPSLGCKTIQWHGRPVSIVCFKREHGALVHLVVIDRAGLPDAPPLGNPRFVQKGEWITASWSEGNRAVMVATQGQEADLRGLL